MLKLTRIALLNSSIKAKQTNRRLKWILTLLDLTLIILLAF